ncbi:ATP-binding protein [Cystobacter fuscus]|uniref:ATP-binding protein n=1 Tax=Cystobacter fuscus TaxID=43 RepID=UPI0037C147CC
MTTPETARGGTYDHLDALPYAMVVVRDSHIIHANPAFCSLMGYSREQVEGACIEQFSTHHAPLMTERHQRRMRGERVPELYETSLRTARGELRVELNVSVSGPDVLVLVRDLSDRLLQRQVLQRMATLGASLPGIHSEQEVLHRVFEGLAALGLSHGYLVPEGDRVRLAHAFIAEHTTPQETRFNGQHLVDAQGSWSPLLRHAWREGAAHAESLAWEADQFVGKGREEPVRAFLGLLAPLPAVCARIDGEREGHALLTVAARWLSEEELPAVRLFAAQVSAALASARIISRLSTHNTALAALNRLAAVAATAREPRDIFEPGAAELFALMRCEAVSFLLWLEQSHEMQLVWQQGLSERAVQFYSRYPLGGTMADAVLRQDFPQVRYVEEFPEPTRTYMRDGQRSALAMAPLKTGSRMVGTLVLAFKERRVLTHLEQETLRAMGVHFAAAIESHRLLQEVRGRAEELARLHEELQRTQRQLVERERLAALGELSAVLAHEVRNPLGAIFNALAALRRYQEPDSPGHLLVGIVSEEAHRLNRLVDDLLDFARPAQPQPQPIPLAHLLEEAVNAASPAQAHVQVEWALAPDVPPIPVDERMMRQAFLNLALNAVQAMPQGGTLRVCARRRAEGPGAIVEFTDTGPGIPPHLRARLFEPFFTTKATGTGLGLAIVRRNLDAHGGQIAIDFPATGGTTFRLELPAAPEPQGPRQG